MRFATKYGKDQQPVVFASESWPSLRAALRDELSGDDLARAMAALDKAAPPPARDARVETAVDNLFHAMKGLGTEEAVIHRTLEKATPVELQAIEERFAAKYCRSQKPLWPSLRDALKDDLSGEDLKRALRELDRGAAATRRPIRPDISSYLTEKLGEGAGPQSLPPRP